MLDKTVSVLRCRLTVEKHWKTLHAVKQKNLTKCANKHIIKSLTKTHWLDWKMTRQQMTPALTSSASQDYSTQDESIWTTANRMSQFGLQHTGWARSDRATSDYTSSYTSRPCFASFNDQSDFHTQLFTNQMIVYSSQRQQRTASHTHTQTTISHHRHQHQHQHQHRLFKSSWICLYV